MQGFGVNVHETITLIPKLILIGCMAISTTYASSAALGPKHRKFVINNVLYSAYHTPLVIRY